ncbi:MAG: DUF935 family protein [Chitinophagales bacterium]|mgnify:CR=1 FL=1|nr:DUF935 family protein [Chitinophagales bacterium]
MPKQEKIITAENINSALKVLPNPSAVLSSKSATVELYHKVAKQHDIFSRSQNYKDAISGMAVTSTSNFFQKYISTKGINFRELIRWVVSARDYGYAVIEITAYDIVEGKTVPTKFKLCKPERFAIGTKGELRYLAKHAGPEGIDIQADYPNKFIWVKNEASDNSPYGIALLDIAYWIAVGLNGNYESIITLSEYDGADKWVGYYNPDATPAEKSEMLNSLLTLKKNSVATLPQGSQVEAIEYKGRTSSSELYGNIDEMFLRKIEHLWFGTDLMMQVQGKGGYSSSNTGFNIREDALAQGVNLVRDCFEQINQFIASINGSLLEDIGLNLTSPRSVTKEEAEVDNIYFQMGLKPTKEFFVNRGYSPSEFEIGNPISALPGNAEFSSRDLDTLFDNFFPK